MHPDRDRKTAAAHADGDWLIFVDADSHPTRELFAEVGRTIQRGHAVAGGSTVSFDTPDRLLTAAISIWNMASRINRWAAGSFIFCKTATFREGGGFNETLYAAEEIDLFRRLKRLASRQKRRIVILSRYPLKTSARKSELYTWREILAFSLRTIARRGRTLRSAEECFAWYDGRR